MRKVATPAVRGLVVLAALVAAVLVFSPAAMAQGCVDDILDDWTNDRLGETVYPLECYDRAITEMPRDLYFYSNAPDAIMEAKAAAFRGDDRFPSSSAGEAGEGSEEPDGSAAPGSSMGGGDDGGVISDVLNLGPSAADDVPLPLLVLALLALLLMGAGAAGLVSRHLQARKATVEGPPSDPPPAV
jgi:hypothetical protein